MFVCIYAQKKISRKILKVLLLIVRVTVIFPTSLYLFALYELLCKRMKVKLFKLGEGEDTHDNGGHTDIKAKLKRANNHHQHQCHSISGAKSSYCKFPLRTQAQWGGEIRGNRDCGSQLALSQWCLSTHSLVLLWFNICTPPSTFLSIHGQLAGAWWSCYWQKNALSCQGSVGDSEEGRVLQGGWHPGKHAHVWHAHQIQECTCPLGHDQVKRSTRVI